MGQVTISTTDVSLHGSVLALTVVCTDPVSLTAMKSASTSASVTFYNPCYDAKVLPAGIASSEYMAYLWQRIQFSLPTAYTVEKCGPISYRLIGLEDETIYEMQLVDG